VHAQAVPVPRALTAEVVLISGVGTWFVADTGVVLTLPLSLSASTKRKRRSPPYEARRDRWFRVK
jgi:hypothetical protein